MKAEIIQKYKPEMPVLMKVENIIFFGNVLKYL